jgi:hypothetical protein
MQGLITEGRTLDFRRVKFDLDERNMPASRDRLYKCIADIWTEKSFQPKKLKIILDSLEEELFYLVAWN